MKSIVAVVSDELHAKIKIYAFKHGKTVKQLILELLQEKMENEKE